MDRRQFLAAAGGGVGALGLGTLSGCRAFLPDSEAEIAALPHRVGDGHFVFDGIGHTATLNPEQHQVLGLDDFSSVGGDSTDFRPENLSYPIDAHRGSDGRLYVLEHGNHRIQVLEPDGSQAGVFGEDELFHPQDMVLVDDRIFVCDTLQHEIHVFDFSGAELTRFGAAQTDDDPAGGLNGPVSLAVDSNRELHVLELGSAQVQVFDLDGRPARAYAGPGVTPALYRPRSITSFDDERLCVADPANGLVHVFERCGSHLGAFTPTDDEGRPAVPVRLTTTPQGELYIWTKGLDAPNA